MEKETDGALLRMIDIEKSFPGVRALDGVSLTLYPGSVHALMGENGAGKSTLMKILFGVYSKDGGKIIFEGEEVEFKNPKTALERGVAMVHQELNQALKLSVMDNIWLGRFPKMSPYLPFTSDRRMADMTRKLFDELSIEVDPSSIVGTLSVSRRQMIEIAKAVSYGARVIVFDEPTSSLNDTEAEQLFRIIDMLKRRGCGIIYISHKMEEILRISDEVTIMRDGARVATRAASDITTDEIISLMVNRPLTNRYPKKECAVGSLLFEARGLRSKFSGIKDVSFSLARGEILGISGLDGSGRTELLELIFGLSKMAEGELYLDGQKVENRTPREAIKNGFALLTEERRRNGIFSILGIGENTTVSSIRRYKRGPLLSDAAIRRTTEESIRRLRIKTPSYKTKIRSLSGGNQQKVIIARWLLTEPTVLMLDEPTRGIDVLAKYEIYQLIMGMAKEGRGVIVVSSEMPELVGICDRILVMSAGRVAGVVDAKETSQEKIMSLALKYVKGPENV